MCKRVRKLICGFDTHNTGVDLIKDGFPVIKDGFPVMGEPSYFFLLVICVTRTHVSKKRTAWLMGTRKHMRSRNASTLWLRTAH